jgi:hypothetical protein
MIHFAHQIVWKQLSKEKFGKYINKNIPNEKTFNWLKFFKQRYQLSKYNNLLTLVRDLKQDDEKKLRSALDAARNYPAEEVDEFFAFLDAMLYHLEQDYSLQQTLPPALRDKIITDFLYITRKRRSRQKNREVSDALNWLRPEIREANSPMSYSDMFKTGTCYAIFAVMAVFPLTHPAVLALVMALMALVITSDKFMFTAIFALISGTAFNSTVYWDGALGALISFILMLPSIFFQTLQIRYAIPYLIGLVGNLLLKGQTTMWRFTDAVWPSLMAVAAGPVAVIATEELIMLIWTYILSYIPLLRGQVIRTALWFDKNWKKMDPSWLVTLGWTQQTTVAMAKNRWRLHAYESSTNTSDRGVIALGLAVGLCIAVFITSLLKIWFK